jgi:3-isopropylmalate/(R)-2-methylmalate dehydratase small subunit
MIIEGTAVAIPEDNVDTDVLYPGPFLNIEDPARMADHLFEGLDPSLRDRLQGDTVLVVGENFGSGSSREHVPQAMRASGVRCVVGRSFARIFYRNCVNLGLLVLQVPGVEAEHGRPVRIDTETGAVRIGERDYAARPVPEFMLETVLAGGLIPWARRRSGAATGD